MPLDSKQVEWLKTARALLGRTSKSDPGDLLTQDLRPEYRGEDVSAAWRFDRGQNESDDSFNLRAQGGIAVTKYHDAKRQTDGTLVTRPDGTVALADGSSAEGTRNYAMDPATGDFATGSGGHRVAQLGPDGRPTGGLVPQGNLVADIVAAMKSGGRQRVEAEHHSSLLAGRDVASAGSITVQGGKVTQVSNESGHYKPEFEHLLQAVEALSRTGAMLDTRITDVDGNDLKTTNPRAFSAWQKVGALEAAVRSKAEHLDDLLNNVDDPMLSEDEQAQAIAELDRLHADMKKLMQGKALLRKAGIGPANRMAGNVKVVFAEAQPGGSAPSGQTGSATVSTKEFLTGTAGPKKGVPLRDASQRPALMQDIRRGSGNDGPAAGADAPARADLQRQIEELDDSLSAAPSGAASATAGAAAPKVNPYDVVKPSDQIGQNAPAAAAVAQASGQPANPYDIAEDSVFGGAQDYGSVPTGAANPYGSVPRGQHEAGGTPEHTPLPPTPDGDAGDTAPADPGPLPPTPT